MTLVGIQTLRRAKALSRPPRRPPKRSSSYCVRLTLDGCCCCGLGACCSLRLHILQGIGESR